MVCIGACKLILSSVARILAAPFEARNVGGPVLILTLDGQVDDRI